MGITVPRVDLNKYGIESCKKLYLPSPPLREVTISNILQTITKSKFYSNVKGQKLAATYTTSLYMEPTKWTKSGLLGVNPSWLRRPYKIYRGQEEEEEEEETTFFAHFFFKFTRLLSIKNKCVYISENIF